MIVFSQLQVGGVQKKIVDLVNELNLASDLPIYILLYRKGKYNLIRQINNPRVQVISYLDRIKVKLPIFFPIFVFWQMLMIRPKAVLVSLDYCVLPVIWTKLVLFWLKIKVVISEDQIPSENMKSQNWYKLRKKLMTVFYPMVEMI